MYIVLLSPIHVQIFTTKNKHIMTSITLHFDHFTFIFVHVLTMLITDTDTKTRRRTSNRGKKSPIFHKKMLLLITKFVGRAVWIMIPNENTD